jgi:hypothetical protein
MVKMSLGKREDEGGRERPYQAGYSLAFIVRAAVQQKPVEGF